MSGLLNDFTSSIENELLDEDLFNDCWVEKVPEKQLRPTEEEIKWLKESTSKDPYILEHPDEADQIYEFALEIERKITFKNRFNEIANIYRRLYISFDLAKVLIWKLRHIVSSINSIIIYPTSNRLRKDHNEAGVVIARGRSRVVRQLRTIRTIWNGMELLFYGDKTGQAEFKNFAKENVPKLNNWIGLSRKGLSERQLEQFNEYEQELQTKLKTEFSRIFENARQRDKLADDFKDIAKNLEIAFEGSLEILANRKEELKYSDQTSIHLSWPQVMMNEVLPNTNILFHELAHVIDFVNGGFNGVPSPYNENLRSDQKQQDLWDSFWEESQEGKMDFLDPYSKTNNLEFFAVSAECFLSNPNHIKLNSEPLYKALKEVFGFDPLTKVTISQWQLFKRLMFSKLNLF